MVKALGTTGLLALMVMLALFAICGDALRACGTTVGEVAQQPVHHDSVGLAPVLSTGVETAGGLTASVGALLFYGSVTGLVLCALGLWAIWRRPAAKDLALAAAPIQPPGRRPDRS